MLYRYVKVKEAMQGYSTILHLNVWWSNCATKLQPQSPATIPVPTPHVFSKSSP
jgi:hypothetical protein